MRFGCSNGVKGEERPLVHACTLNNLAKLQHADGEHEVNSLLTECYSQPVPGGTSDPSDIFAGGCIGYGSRLM